MEQNHVHPKIDQGKPVFSSVFMVGGVIAVSINKVQCFVASLKINKEWGELFA